MARITKYFAETISKKLAKPAIDKATNLKKDYHNIIKEEYMKTIPEPVLLMFEEYPKYIVRSSSIKLGWTYSYDTVWLDKSVPQTEAGAYFTPKGNAIDKITKAKHAKEKAQEEADELEAKIYTTLINLGTFKEVEKHFPEAFAYLPKKDQCTAISINVEALRNELKNL